MSFRLPDAPALHIEQFPTTPAPRWLLSAVRGNQVTLSWAGIRLHVDFAASGFVRDVRQPMAVRGKLGRHFVGGRLDDRTGLTIPDRQHPYIELKKPPGISLLDKGERRPVGRPRGWCLAARTGGEAFRDPAPVGGLPIQVVLTAGCARAEDDSFPIWRKNAEELCPSTVIGLSAPRAMS